MLRIHREHLDPLAAARGQINGAIAVVFFAGLTYSVVYWIRALVQWLN